LDGSRDKNLPYFVVEKLASLAERGLCSGTVSVRLSVPLLPGCRYPGALARGRSTGAQQQTPAVPCLCPRSRDAVGHHWRRQGGPSPPSPQSPGKNFLVKIERLSSLPPAKSGRACYDNPTERGHFYQMPNMYTCIAYLIEIRKFC